MVSTRPTMETALETLTQPNWGSIHVARGEDEHGRWLEVRDDALGMSEAVLVGPLLDFGTSYWRSELCSEEFPGLLASGFRSVGEFGIGFFSVFMWGAKVQVKTRSCRAAQTLVLEFERGLGTPPLLRPATESEHLIDGGTVVRVWLAARAPGEESMYYERTSSPAAKCKGLCPTLDVDVFVQEAETAGPLQVVEARDWLTLDAAAFVKRIALNEYENVEDVLVERVLVDDDPAVDQVLKMLDLLVDPASGEVVGRACLRPPWLRTVGTNAIVSRGLRLGMMKHSVPVIGVLEGVPITAARDEGRIVVRPEVLDAWHEQQEKKRPRACSRASIDSSWRACSGP